MKLQRIYWICQVVGWVLYTFIIAILSIIFYIIAPPTQPVSKFKFVLGFALTIGIGFSLSHIYRYFIKKRGWAFLSMRQLVTRIFFSCILLALLWEIVKLSLLIPLGIFPAKYLTPKLIILTSFPPLFYWCVIFLIWSLLYFGFHLVINYKKVEIEKWKLQSAVREAELNVLRSQMNPHFMFNSMNSIRAMILEDPEKAQIMVTQLANILRYSLRLGNTTTVTLNEELEIVTDYLALEAIRLEDRLNVTVSINAKTLHVQVPTMLIQTLVENGIKHGIAVSPEGGEIQLFSTLNDGMMHIRVINTGQLIDSSESRGIGLQNVNERLQLLYGESASLELKCDDPNQVTAHIKIPLSHTAQIS